MIAVVIVILTRSSLLSTNSWDLFYSQKPQSKKIQQTSSTSIVYSWPHIPQHCLLCQWYVIVLEILMPLTLDNIISEKA